MASRDGDLLAYDRGEFFEYARRVPTSRLLDDDDLTEQARALEEYLLGLYSAVGGGGLGPFFYRYARPGEL